MYYFFSVVMVLLLRARQSATFRRGFVSPLGAQSCVRCRQEK